MYLIYSTIGIFLITVLIFYAYLKKPSYGISLAITSGVLIVLAVSWNLTESSRIKNSAEKISLQQIMLSNQSLQPAYGNRYLFKAKLENRSPSALLMSVQLQLTLFNENISQWSKTWLDAEKTDDISVYFTFGQLAKELKGDEVWKVKVIATKAR